MSNIWFTSDLHFGHKNIIRHCDRPFDSAAAMDVAMVRSWNERVCHEDTVYVLGDFAFESAKKAKTMLSRLAGRKILIRGNHDVEGEGFLDQGWDAVHDSLAVNVGPYTFYLHHYPLQDWPRKWRGAFHLYGHVHGNIKPLHGSMDVGVDTWGGAPVSVEEVVRAITPFSPPKAVQTRYVEKAWKSDLASGLKG